MGCHDVRPLLPAQAAELTPAEARARAEHVAGCQRCAAEAAAYRRLGRALAVMRGLEADPPDELLELVLAGLGRRRVNGPTVAAVAAGSAGVVVAGVVLARALRQRQTRRLAVAAIAGHARRGGHGGHGGRREPIRLRPLPEHTRLLVPSGPVLAPAE